MNFVLKNKDETFQKFKTWRALMENQLGRKIKVLKSDNGLEFCKFKFDKLHGDFQICKSYHFDVSIPMYKTWYL